MTVATDPTDLILTGQEVLLLTEQTCRNEMSEVRCHLNVSSGWSSKVMNELLLQRPKYKLHM